MKPLLQAPSTAALTVATAVVALLAALMLGLLAPAWADPMRPLLPPPAPSAPAATAAAPAQARAHPATAWPALLALRQDSDGRHQALFGDRWLAVGDRLDSPAAGVATGGEAATVVTAIDGHSVQLRQGRQRHTLHLLPPLRYSVVAASSPAASPRTAAARTAPRAGPPAPAPVSVSPSAPGR
jgi:hypothetical protein